ncbi:MAG: hypothetical protein KAI72_00495, partial [Candidatus Pacebacteria bacterium]|nr:hypothetical protein [Candidatus Paceibacterota bacterium]
MMLKKITLCFVFIMVLFVNRGYAEAIIIDHNCTNLSQIPDVMIEQAKNTLHIAYQHTSHGSQIISGMNALK